MNFCKLLRRWKNVILSTLSGAGTKSFPFGCRFGEGVPYLVHQGIDDADLSKLVKGLKYSLFPPSPITQLLSAVGEIEGSCLAISSEQHKRVSAIGVEPELIRGNTDRFIGERKGLFILTCEPKHRQCRRALLLSASALAVRVAAA